MITSCRRSLYQHKIHYREAARSVYKISGQVLAGHLRNRKTPLHLYRPGQKIFRQAALPEPILFHRSLNPSVFQRSEDQ